MADRRAAKRSRPVVENEFFTVLSGLSTKAMVVDQSSSGLGLLLSSRSHADVGAEIEIEFDHSARTGRIVRVAEQEDGCLHVGLEWISSSQQN